MKAIEPVETLCHQIIYSNVPLDHPEWVVGTSYAKGATVVADDCGAVVYESLVNNNTTDPLTSPLDWLEIGVSNYFAMFDSKDSTQTVNNNEIVVEIEFNSVVDAIALMNLDGALSVRFEAWRGIDDVKVLDMTVSLSENVVFDWYSYFFAGFKEVTNFISFSLPTIRNGRGRMTLIGDVVKIGSLIYGKAFDIGGTVYPFSTGIQDFSTKDRDPFGNFSIVERAFNYEMSANVIINNSRIDAVQQFLAKYRATPLVWAATEDGTSHGVIFGFYTDGVIQRNTIAYGELPLQITGVTA